MAGDECRHQEAAGDQRRRKQDGRGLRAALARSLRMIQTCRGREQSAAYRSIPPQDSRHDIPGQVWMPFLKANTGCRLEILSIGPGIWDASTCLEGNTSGEANRNAVNRNDLSLCLMLHNPNHRRLQLLLSSKCRLREGTISVGN